MVRGAAVAAGGRPPAAGQDELGLLRAAVEGGLDGVVVVSADGTMIANNAKFQAMWPIPADVIASGSDDAALQSVLDKLVDPQGFLRRVRELYADPDSSSRDELLLRDGRVFDRYGAALRGADGSYLGWAWYFRDVSAERVAARAALEASERFAALARTLQESLLPPHLPDVPGIEVAARHLPAGHGGELVGDFYDVFQTSRARWSVVMGDVCGKGVEAAKLTALARHTIRAAAIGHQAPHQVLELLNTALLQQHPDSERFVSALYVGLQQRKGSVRARISSAGHPPALLRTRAREVHPVGEPGLVLGLFGEVRLGEHRRDLRPGDALVLYTDGVLEARRGGEQFGEQRLTQLLEQLPVDATAADIAAAVQDAVLAFGGVEPADDTAVLVVRVPEQAGGPSTG